MSERPVKSELIKTHVLPTLKAEIVKAANTQGESISVLVRDAVKRELARRSLNRG